jgi:RND superfamily putative drug exporter
VHEKTPFTRSDRALERPSSLARDRTLARIRRRLRRRTHFTGSKQLQSGATGESARAESMMKTHQARPSGVQLGYAYLHSAALRAGDPAFRTAIANVRATMAEALAGRPPGPAPTGRTPNGALLPAGDVTTRISTDGHSVLVAAPPNENFSTGALAAAVSSDGNAQVSAVLDDNSADTGNSDLHRAERLSVPVTLLVLLIAFGALGAAAVPVLLAVTAVVAAFGLLGPISHVFPLDSSVKTVVLPATRSSTAASRQSSLPSRPAEPPSRRR